MIDLHTHTDVSDGTVAPPGLVRLAVSTGLEALAITDHDTLDGYDIASPEARRAGLNLICGVELSTRFEQEKTGTRHPSVHLLSYFLGEAPSANFRVWLSRLQESRRQRNIRLISKLQSLGVQIELAEVQAIGRNLTGRPHFAQVLLKKGYVKSIQEAFDKYLADQAQAAVERDEPGLVEAIHKVVEGGGCPVLAHPVRLLKTDENSLRLLLDRLVPEGLWGIEVFHSEHGLQETALFSRLGKRFNLAMTGGSDFHGANKPAIELGTGCNRNLQIPFEILKQMHLWARPHVKT